MNKENHRTLVALVVEDNYGDFFLVKEYLSETNYNVVLHNAGSFLEAKNFIDSGDNSADLILLDITLPDHRGEKLISDMFTLANGIPIIVLSGRSDDEFIAKAYNLGVAGYIPKDHLNPVVLDGMINDFLNQ